MTEKKKIISNVPTNIITGFLGVGKTSLILKLLQKKPRHERWAVLVNEFGDIGIDGSLFKGKHRESKGVFVREVPGGCMCCTAGLPMRVALNVLLQTAKPDRLLIEPTGLGHPVEVLQTLSNKHYKDVLSIQKILTLVDARKLSDPRYTTHQTFNQQIEIADTIIGNKQDLYQPGDKKALKSYVLQKASSQVQIVFTEQGDIPIDQLTGTTMAKGTEHSHHEHSHTDLKEANIPASGVLKAENQGEGFQSVGWRFSPDKVFERERLIQFFKGCDVNRLKGVFITNEGVFGYNRTSDELSEWPLDECFESRVEIISTNIHSKWESELTQCIHI